MPPGESHSAEIAAQVAHKGGQQGSGSNFGQPEVDGADQPALLYPLQELG